MANAKKPNPKIRNRSNAAKRRKLIENNHKILKNIKKDEKS
jgi:hypothetical protein